MAVGVGQGLVSPTISGLLSRITPEGEQGAVFGTLSSAQTLARMANYLVANLLFGRGNTAAPFWEAAAIAARRRWAWRWSPCRRSARLAGAGPVDKDLGEPIPSGAAGA